MNGEERLSAALSADGALSATILYLGHVPEPGRRRRQAEERGAQDQFKGSIQDVRVGGEECSFVCGCGVVWLGRRAQPACEWCHLSPSVEPWSSSVASGSLHARGSLAWPCFGRLFLITA